MQFQHTNLTDDTLFTIDEIAAKLGVHYTTISRRIERLGLKPLIEARIGGMVNGKPENIPAKYSLTQFTDLQQQQLQMRMETQIREKEQRMRKKEQALIQRVADKATPEVKQVIMSDYVEQLRADNSLASAREVAHNAMGFLAMFAEKVAILDKALDEQEVMRAKIDMLETKLDLSSKQMTVETYAIMVLKKTITRQKAASITRKLHNAGKIDLGKIPSKYDNNMPATLWETEHLDYALEQGWFNE